MVEKLEERVERVCGGKREEERNSLQLWVYEGRLVETWEVRKQKKLRPPLQWLTSKVQRWASRASSELRVTVGCG